MVLESIVVQEIEYPSRMDWELVDRWADGIPTYSENDPKNPEWRATPTIFLDLTSDGYGPVYVKNEADRRCNPTGTIKDRAAWELTTLYRDFARMLALRKKKIDGSIESIPVPRLSMITAGNVGKAVSHAFEKFGLPPLKLLVSSLVLKERLDQLKGTHADIYLVDLGLKALDPEEIKKLTKNEGGVDITSVVAFEPHAIFYDWHVHEAFNEEPDQVFVPYGSGRLFENFLTWQQRSVRNDATGRRDPRLRVSLRQVASMDVLGAEPIAVNSVADKLTKPFHPFELFKDRDISALSSFGFTGRNTGVYPISEVRLIEAYALLSRYCETEPSAAAGLALYLDRFQRGLVNPRRKTLVVNTGRGI